MRLSTTHYLSDIVLRDIVFVQKERLVQITRTEKRPDNAETFTELPISKRIVAPAGAKTCFRY